MPNPSELERLEQERQVPSDSAWQPPMRDEGDLLAQQNRDEMARVSGTLNRDAYACVVLEQQIKEQEEILAARTKYLNQRLEENERLEADISTAKDRIASLRDTLSRIEKPHG